MLFLSRKAQNKVGGMAGDALFDALAAFLSDARIAASVKISHQLVIKTGGSPQVRTQTKHPWDKHLSVKGSIFHVSFSGGRGG